MADELVRFQARLKDCTIEATAPLPAEPVAAERLLPIFRGVADTLLRTVSEKCGRAERPVTCAAGCAACCQHLVPVSHPEARRLLEALEEMPPARREQIAARFQENLDQLSRAGAVEPLRAAGRDLAAAGTIYGRIRLRCPFLLEDDSCAVYEDRPMVCREYMVASPPARCYEDDLSGVARVRLPVIPSNAMNQLETGDFEYLALPLLLEWAANAKGAADRRTGREWLERFLSGLNAPPPPAA